MIISFYSYKGGVGRTQLAANLAAYFCYYKNKKVLLIDWDLEAPGLHYYFRTKTDKNKKGVIELFLDYVNAIKTNEAIDEKDLPRFDNNYISNIVEVPNNKGRIDLVKAGIYDEQYNKKTNNFNWHEFYELIDGKIFVEFLKSELKKLDYDYIFIDSRTGMSDYSGICNIQMPDANIIIMSPTLQNLEGGLRISESIKNSEYVKEKYRQAVIFPLLSRIDLSIEHKSEEWIELFAKTFDSFIQSISKFFIVSKQDYLRDALLDYKRDISFGEQVLFSDDTKDIKTKTLAGQYKNIAKYIENISVYNTQQTEASIVKLIISGVDRIGLIDDITKAIVNDPNANMRSITIDANNGLFIANTLIYIKQIGGLDFLNSNLENVEGIDKITSYISQKDFTNL